MLWLMNENGDLLLARRADHKAQDPGLWGPSVTGKLEEGETFEDAVVREVEEELNLSRDLLTPSFLFDTNFRHPDGETRQFKVFIANISSEVAQNVRIDANEVAEVKWLSIKKIKALLNSKPGETVVASAFVLWDQIFAALESPNSQ